MSRFDLENPFKNNPAASLILSTINAVAIITVPTLALSCFQQLSNHMKLFFYLRGTQGRRARKASLAQLHHCCILPLLFRLGS